MYILYNHHKFTYTRSQEMIHKATNTNSVSHMNMEGTRHTGQGHTEQ